MKRRHLALLCIAWLAAACTKNPLGPGLPSAAAQASSSACPDRYNFQSSSSVSAWTAPVGWSPPVSDSNLVWDPSHSSCGNGAMRGSLDIAESAADGGAAADGILFTLFPGVINASNAYVVLDIYFAQPPPAELGMRFYFIDRYDNWITPNDAEHFALQPGWNRLTEFFDINGASQVGDITHAVGFLIQFANNGNNLSGPPYVSDFWIGGINW